MVLHLSQNVPQFAYVCPSMSLHLLMFVHLEGHFKPSENLPALP